ncbi:MAG: peptide chain release factor N(5)-glutamine methyltransferase, partial [Anaerolineales bacterium]|nr:peptide chain release factor N(5)-glutamine methyltransferase [Anaerolineales bacterium]
MKGEASLREALRWGEQTLARSALDSTRLDAEVLLTHVLGITRAQLHAHPQSQLSSVELTRYRQLIERRAQREPVAYIVGHKEFYGLDLFVDSRVLIPRPETELLVEKAIEISQRQPVVADVCKSWGSERRLSSEAYRNQASGSVFADIGTGSGAIAVSLAVHLPQALHFDWAQCKRPSSGQALVYATDASPGALEVAARNCRRHGVEERVRLLQG